MFKKLFAIALFATAMFATPLTSQSIIPIPECFPCAAPVAIIPIPECFPCDALTGL